MSWRCGFLNRPQEAAMDTLNQQWRVPTETKATEEGKKGCRFARNPIVSIRMTLNEMISFWKYGAITSRLSSITLIEKEGRASFLFFRVHPILALMRQELW